MEPSTTDTPNRPSGWDELRRLADQLELEIHLGGMEARDRWKTLKPQLDALEHKIREAGARAGSALEKETAALRELFRSLKNGLDHPDP